MKDKSRRPHHHPNEHTAEEIKLIKNYKANNKKTGLVVLWVKLRQAGYTRTVQGLYHVMRRLGIYEKAPSKKKKYESIEWETGNYPGEKVDRCKICSERMNESRTTREEGKISSIYSNR